MTVIRTDKVSFSAYTAAPAAGLIAADASDRVSTIQLSGTVAAGQNWSVGLKLGSGAAEYFTHVTTAATAKLSGATNALMGQINDSTDYAATVCDTSNNMIRILRYAGAETLTTYASSGALTQTDASGYSDTIQLTGTPATSEIWSVGLKLGAGTTDHFSYVTDATTAPALSDVVTALTGRIDGSDNYIAFESGNNTITVIRQAGSDTLTAYTDVGALATTDASAYTDTIQLSGAPAAGQTWSVGLKLGAAATNYFNYVTGTAAPSLATVVTGLKGLIDASAGYNAYETGNGTITILGQTGDNLATGTARPDTSFTDASAWVKTLEISGTITGRETWTATLNDGTAIPFSTIAGIDGDTLDAPTVSQSLAAAIDAHGSYKASAVEVSAGVYVVTIHRQNDHTSFTPSLAIAPAPTLVSEGISGSARVAWAHEIDLDDFAVAGDRWTVSADGVSYLDAYIATADGIGGGAGRTSSSNSIHWP